MSLVAAQYFVESTDADAVELAVAESLAAWAREVGELPVNGDGVVLPSPERRVVLLPPVGGFVTVIEESGRVDRALARTLRAKLGARVLAAELEGHFLEASILTLEPGDDESEWTAGERLDDEAMPIYEDAEAELFERLVASGVPAGVVAVEWEELLDTQAPVLQGARIRAEAGAEGLDKTLLPFGSLDASDLVPGPRVRPDLWVSSPDGAQVIESRRLAGTPHRAAIEAIAAIEERQLERILGTLAWAADQEFLPRVVFRYDGLDDVESFLDALEDARAARPLRMRWDRTAWLSIRGLTQALARATERLLPDFEVGRTLGERVEFRHLSSPNVSFFVDLRELWAAYRAEPEGLVRLCATMLVKAREEAPAPAEFDTANLVPMLVADASHGLEQLAARPFTEGVWVLLAHDSGRSLVPVTREALAATGLGFEDALDGAVAQLELETERHDAFLLFEQPEGQTLIAEFPDAASASRILSPAVRAHVSQQLGDECFVAIPARDVLLAAEGTREARRWLEREVAIRFTNASLPLTPMIWTIQNGELIEDGPVDPASFAEPA